MPNIGESNSWRHWALGQCTGANNELLARRTKTLYIQNTHKVQIVNYSMNANKFINVHSWHYIASK